MDSGTKKTLWAAADKLRSSMNAAEYEHIVLGPVFLKYISDAFDERCQTLAKEFKAPKNDLYAGGDAGAEEQLLEDKDYYSEVHVYWVPAVVRWEAIRNAAKQADIGKLIDDALIAIEQANPELKKTGLDKRFARTQLEPGRFGEGREAKDDPIVVRCFANEILIQEPTELRDASFPQFVLKRLTLAGVC